MLGGSLTKEQFYVLNNFYNDSIGRTPIFSDLYLNQVLEKSSVTESLMKDGLVDEQFELITDSGMEALKPYEVSGAVIMAAGPSTRCIPISLEKPKGLFEVKGERLIERLIRQLKDAGIDNITVVLGYKKEMLYYLKDLYQVRLIENRDYLHTNNIHSLYAAKDYLKNAYICACDDYYVENPFNKYEYQSFYAGMHVDQQTNEMYVFTDEDNRIVKMQKNLVKGNVILGHSFWNHEFADAFIECVERDRDNGKYATAFWEWLVKDNIDDMPPLYYKKYAPRAIVEFDYFDDLRRFDSEYVKQSNSKIIENIISVFHCKSSEIRDFRNISEGMTNTSFIFKIGGIDYIYRHPGDGTDKIINRKTEKHSLELAKEWGLDPTYIYLDVDEGWKISEYVNDFREPDYYNFEDSKKILSVLRRLHSLPIMVDYCFEPWENACELECILKEKKPDCFDAFVDLKEKIQGLYQKTEGDGVKKCFCHADTYKPNWMIKPDGTVILIDWEYSGYSDPGIDVGYYIVDAMYDIETAKRFIVEYLEGNTDEKLVLHYLIYTALIAYYWFVWALYRESCGADMGEALTNWRIMAERFAEYLWKEF